MSARPLSTISGTPPQLAGRPWPAHDARRSRPWQRALLRTVLALGAALLAGAALLVLMVAASGALNQRAGNWTTQVELPGGIDTQLNVPGLVRLATSPLGRWLLDGHTATSQSGVLRFAAEGPALVVRCAPCRIDDARLAAQPITLRSAELRLTRGRAADASDRIDGELASGAVRLRFTARLERDHIEFDGQLAATPLAEVYRLFGDAIAETRVARIDGQVSAQGTLVLPAGQLRTQVAFTGFEVGGLATERLQSGWFSQACPTVSEPARRVTTGDGEPRWTAAGEMGPWLAAAVLAAQDAAFESHGGFDPAALAATVTGADRQPPATLTQQLAQTLFTGDAGTLAQRLRTLLYAVEMERTLGKPRILELYLNTAHWGPGVCGARAAARLYFRKPPARLTPLEAAWLAGALADPQAAYTRQFLHGSANTARAAVIVRQLRELPRESREREAQQRLTFAAPPRPPTSSRAAQTPGWLATR
jgi:hypothetical protein